MARIRNKEYGTVHHLTSRIAHQAFFLKEAEQDDFLALVKRVSMFSGVELIGWCIMNNHFHLYVYLPVPPDLSDDEVLARYHLLKGDVSCVILEGQTINHCIETGKTYQTRFAKAGDGRDEARTVLVRSLRRRMYSIAEYMRMVKKWFSDRYNERSGHKGTMWDAPYADNSFFLPERPGDYVDLRDILAYIHLNPIRAAITDKFDGYEWSSYTAYRRGDPDAVKAMHFAYCGCDTDEEIVRIHEGRMCRLLEDWKRRRAEEIARKRAEGFKTPIGSLTDECMIAQAATHAAEVQKELEQLHAERELAKGRSARRELIMKQIRDMQILHPDFSAGDIASVIDVPVRTVYRYLKSLRSAA